MTPPVRDAERVTTQLDTCCSEIVRRLETRDDLLADRIRASRLARGLIGETYLKLTGRDLPEEDEAATRLIKRVARNVFIDEMRQRQRDHAFSFEPDDPAWNQFAVEPAFMFGWDGPFAREKLFLLIEIATAFLSAHHRRLIRGIFREWEKGPRQHRLSVAEVHARLEQPCDLTPHYCVRLAFMKMGRIARGLAVAVGAVPPALRVPKKRERAWRNAIEQIAPAAETTDTVF
jgi:DNA-directed RNA polymerase specialized sigma24 family protein